MNPNELNTTGKQLFVMREDGLLDDYEVQIVIDFDFPEVRQKIKEMSLWSGDHPDEDEPFEEHLAFVLRKIAYVTYCFKSEGYNDSGVLKEFLDEDGFYPMDGSHGILIKMSSFPDVDMDSFTVYEQEEYMGYLTQN